MIVCEGYTDVIGLATAGLPRAVATCGTALTEDHFRVLKNFARRVVLAYDADAAGQAAAARFYDWEKRFEVDIAVADLPPGSDPGDLAASDPAALKAAVENARPFLGFRVERALAGADIRSAEGRAKAAEAAMAVVREHPSDLVRDQYVMEVADRVRIHADRLRLLAVARPALPRAEQQGRTSPEARQATHRAPPPAPAGPELEALRVAVNHPEAVAANLHEVLFSDPAVLDGYRALRRSTTLHEAIAGAEPATAALLQRLAVEDDESDPDDVMARAGRGGGEAGGGRPGGRRRAQSANPRDYADDMGWLKLSIEELRDPSAAVEATGRLVRWLIQRFEEQG